MKLVGCEIFGNNTIYVHVIHEIPTSNKTGSQPYQKESIDDEFYRTGSSSNWNQSLWVEGGSPASTGAVCRIAGNVISGNGGINVLSPNKHAAATDTMVANITSSFNTGYMHGDNQLAYLADTDSTNVSDTELMTNYTFVRYKHKKDEDFANRRIAEWVDNNGRIILVFYSYDLSLASKRDTLMHQVSFIHITF